MKIDLKRYPYEMSGGQQQLISIMRALVVEPEILFLDEPFSALDYEMTLFMREQLQRIFMETGTTTVLVSHDLEEAVYLADRILLLSRGPAQIADFVPFRCRRGRAPTQRFRKRISSPPRRIASRCSSARSARDEACVRPVSAGAGRDRPDRSLVFRGLEADRRSGAVAVAGRHVPGHVQRHGRRQAGLRLPEDSGADDSVHGDRRRHRHSARHFSRRLRAAVPVGRIRDRLLSLDAGFRHVPAVSGAVRASATKPRSRSRRSVLRW